MENVAVHIYNDWRQRLAHKVPERDLLLMFINAKIDEGEIELEDFNGFLNEFINPLPEQIEKHYLHLSVGNKSLFIYGFVIFRVGLDSNIKMEVEYHTDGRRNVLMTKLPGQQRWQCPGAKVGETILKTFEKILSIIEERKGDDLYILNKGRWRSVNFNVRYIPPCKSE